MKKTVQFQKDQREKFKEKKLIKSFINLKI